MRTCARAGGRGSRYGPPPRRRAYWALHSVRWPGPLERERERLLPGYTRTDLKAISQLNRTVRPAPSPPASQQRARLSLPVYHAPPRGMWAVPRPNGTSPHAFPLLAHFLQPGRKSPYSSLDSWWARPRRTPIASQPHTTRRGPPPGRATKERDGAATTAAQRRARISISSPLPRARGRSSLAQSARPAADAMPLALAQLQDLRERISDRLRPWSRSAQFWVRAADIYTSYKVGELAAGPLVVCPWCARRYAPVVRCGRV